jgi:GNAT superfamily N-acetyltransferase
MEQLVIGRARPDEAQTMTQVALASKRHWGYPQAWIEMWREGMRITPQKMRACEFWNGRLGEEIVAIYSIRPLAGDVYELEDFWVAPACIGRGFGRQMFEHLRARLAELGAAGLKIVSDPHARPFYERMGAVRVGEAPSLPEGRVLPVLEYRNW